jgi:Cu(I)/Ag(I) efflux system membrane fusion protein
MTTRVILICAALAAAFGLGVLATRMTGDPAAGGAGQAAAEEAAQRWTCSMHPQIILPSNDQQCPICFMDLIPLDDSAGEGLDPDELALGESALALAEVQTERAARRPAWRALRLVGKVKEDETRTRTITARVGGRLDRLHVDATGQLVTPGMKLAEIYSPQLYSAQAELQAALAAADGRSRALAGSAATTVQAVERRLRLWGLDEAQIQAIREGGAISEHLTVRAPVGGVVLQRRANQGDYVNTGSVIYSIADLDQVWVTLDAFEADIPWLAEGQEVTFTARAHPGREFAGSILFINPVLDGGKRTVEVRLQVANEAGLLKPGMLVTAVAQVALDAQGNPLTRQEAETPGTAHPLLIPATAPLLTGDRAVVYVRRDHEGQSVFQGRQVRLGPRAGDHYIVTAGLQEGEEVVSRGSFKIDSALQIQAQPSMMSRDPVGEEFLTALGLTLNEYYRVQVALAADDDQAAVAALPGLDSALAALAAAAEELSSTGRVFWAGHGKPMIEAAAMMKAAGGIEARRLAFEPVSDNLWALADHFGHGSRLTVRRFHCPMAMDGAGAYWLQDDQTVANPYYGSAMLRCGSQVEVIQ